MATYGNEKYPHQEDTYKIIGIAMEIHRILGKGFSKYFIKMHLDRNLNCAEFYTKEKKNILYHIKL